MIIFLFGRPGAGKTAIGSKLADIWRLPYIDCDDFYTQQEKHAIQDDLISEEDSDAFWKRVVHHLALQAPGRLLVASQSLFRESQRQYLRERFDEHVVLVYLDVPEAVCYERLGEREAAYNSGSERHFYGVEQYKREAHFYEEPSQETVNFWYQNNKSLDEAVIAIKKSLEDVYPSIQQWLASQ